MINKKEKVIGIICECNPFHKGHEKIINLARKDYDASFVILIMSGSFVQRGEPACENLCTRIEKAINKKIGADLIIELPIEYSLSSAKYFAKASINILNKLKIVDNIIFGSNINNIAKLKTLASKNIITNKKKSIKSGKIYEDIYGEKLSPNDILGVEYIRAINETKSKITPICIKRDEKLPTASSIRCKMKKKDLVFNDLTKIFKKILFDAKMSKIDLTSFYNVSRDFSNQMLKLFDIDNGRFIKKASLDDIAHKLATKEKTLANVKRNLLHIILDIKEKDVAKEKYGEKISLLHILGYSARGKELLSKIKTPFYVGVNTYPKKRSNSYYSYKLYNLLNNTAII